MRKYLANSSSDPALKSYEPLFAKYFDLIVKKLGQTWQKYEDIGVVVWYNLTTFDITGSLAFGQDFSGVASGREHFWIAIANKRLRLGALSSRFRLFPMLSTVVQTLFGSLIDKLLHDSRRHQKYTMDLVQENGNPISITTRNCSFQDNRQLSQTGRAF